MMAARPRAKNATVTRPRASKSPDGIAPPYETLHIVVRDAVATLTIDRPDVHNAFNEQLIAELTAALRALDRDDDVRVIVLTGAGKSFCAGADLQWMQRMAGFSPAQNLADAKKLARMLAMLNRISKPTVARVSGAVYGGGVGLVACCDVGIGADDAVFALSEVRLGLIPATISPYVIEAIGARNTRRYFVTGERFSAAKALQLGLLHETAPSAELDARVEEICRQLLAAGPRAQAEAKALIRAVAHRPIDAGVLTDTSRRIARLRASPEGKEGVEAFLAKRKPSWLPANDG